MAEDIERKDVETEVEYDSKHLDDFYEAIILILSKAYQAFPYGTGNQIFLENSLAKYVFMFLTESGIIEGDTPYEPGKNLATYVAAKLSTKGFILLTKLKVAPVNMLAALKQKGSKNYNTLIERMAKAIISSL